MQKRVPNFVAAERKGIDSWVTGIKRVHKRGVKVIDRVDKNVSDTDIRETEKIWQMNILYFLLLIYKIIKLTQ